MASMIHDAPPTPTNTMHDDATLWSVSCAVELPAANAVKLPKTFPKNMAAVGRTRDDRSDEMRATASDGASLREVKTNSDRHEGVMATCSSAPQGCNSWIEARDSSSIDGIGM